MPRGRPLKGDEKREAISFRLPASLIEELREVAAIDKRSMTAVLEIALEEYFRKARRAAKNEEAA